jgi:hypothetical protein
MSKFWSNFFKSLPGCGVGNPTVLTLIVSPSFSTIDAPLLVVYNVHKAKGESVYDFIGQGDTGKDWQGDNY